MKLILLFVFSTFFIFACSDDRSENKNFMRLTNNFMEKFLQTNPELATALGDHRFDSRLSNYSKNAIENDKKFLQTYLDSLQTITIEKLDKVNQIDYKILNLNIEAMLYQLSTLKEYEWNPQFYNIGNAVYTLLARDFAPLRDRLSNLKQRLQAIPELLEHAKTNLQNPPKINTETAILQNKGNIGLVTTELDFFLKQEPDLQKIFTPIQKEAVKALEAYGQWLEEELLPRSNGDFRLGDEKYRKKLYYTLESDLSKETILNTAQSELKKTQQNLYETAVDLYQKFYPKDKNIKNKNQKQVIKAVLDRLAEEHPNNESIVQEAEKKLQYCTKFVKESSLVTVPEQPLKIIVMPEFERGVAVAYCDAPGALEEKGETFYAISPTPEDWTQERVISFFREYNNYMLDNLTVHEAMPGHYLQLMHNNDFKAPTKIRAIFSSGTFIEGWATYAEQLMVEAGYGGPELKMQQLKMRLRLIINAIIDQKIHTDGMTEEEAIVLMMEEGFQEEGEAVGKWRRACLTSTQLATYFVGNLEVNEIRRQYEAKYGTNTDMKPMHDKMLSFGSPPPKFVKEMLDL